MHGFVTYLQLNRLDKKLEYLSHVFKIWLVYLKLVTKGPVLFITAVQAIGALIR